MIRLLGLNYSEESQDDASEIKYEGEEAPSACTLNKLYPELRVLVFKHAFLVEPGSNVTPPLLAALRADKKLYTEAMEVYYSINTFSLTGKNTYSWVYHKSDSSKRLIKNLMVDLR